MLITCDLIQALSASSINSQKSDIVEFYKDHEVTEYKARESLRQMTQEDFLQPAHCRACTNEQKNYCKSPALLKDHCCCNQSHNKG